MTRETKVGLVVSCSFLCLVGVVVASKWRNGDTTTKEPEQQEARVTAVKEGQPGNPLIDPAKKTEGRPGDRPIGPGVAPLPLPVNSINPSNKTEAQIQQDIRDAQNRVEPGPAAITPQMVPPVAGFGSPAPKPLELAREENKGGVTVPTPDVVKPLGGIEVAQGGNTTPAVPLPSVPPAVNNKVEPFAPLPPAPNDPAAKKVEPFPPLLPAASDPGAKKIEPFAPLPPAPNDPAAKKVEPFPPLLPAASDPAAKKVEPFPPLLPAASDPAAKKIEPFAPLPPAPNDPAAKKVEPFAPLPPAANDPAAKKIEPFAPLPPAASDPAAKKIEPFAPLPPAASNSAPALPPQQTGSIPQIPRESAPDLPPIVVKGAKQQPVVQETPVDEYTCQLGDSVFENLSMRFYGTARYADALKAYNRTNSMLVSAGGSNLTIDPPVLTPGQKVLHPPKEILERDFGSSIRATAIAPPPNPMVAPTVKLTAPTPLQPAPIREPAPIAAPAAGASYRVQNPNGESILDIAERLLGNRSRWTAIYDLNRANPAVQPQFRIPVGTELKMPASCARPFTFSARMARCGR